MRSIFFLLPFFLLIQCPSASARLLGQAKLDSLLGALNKATKDDSNKVLLINDVAYNYQYINPDEGLRYAQKALDLSASIGWEKGKAMAAVNLGHNYFRKSDYNTALEHYLSSMKQMEAMGDKKGVAAAANGMANAYRNMGDYPKTLECYTRSLNISKEINDTFGIRRATHNLGSYYVDKSDYPKALEFHFRALKMYESSGEREGLGRIHDNIGTDYLLLKDYAKALEHLNRAITIDDELGDKESIGNHLFSIGRVYSEQKSNAVALHFFTEAASKYGETGNKRGIANATSEIGKMLVKQGDYVGAIGHFFTSLTIDEQIGDKKNQAKNLDYISNAYLAIVKDPSAFARTGAVTVKEIPGIIAVPENLVPKGREALLDKAVEFLQKGVGIAKEIGAPDILDSCYKNLADASKQKGDYEKAIEYTQNYYAIRDSLLSMANSEKMGRMLSEKDFEKQHYADSVNASMKLSLVQMKYEHQRYLAIAAGSGLLLLIAFSIVLIRNNRTQRQLNNTIKKLVAEQEETIRKRTAELADSNSRLKHSNKKLLELIQYNAHNLREPLARVMGVINIRDLVSPEEFNTEIWPQMQKAVTDLDNSIRDVVRIADETITT